MSTGWKPAVRTGPGWEHHITVDFLKKTRVTKLTFTPLAASKSVTAFQIQYSNDGIVFTKPCGVRRR